MCSRGPPLARGGGGGGGGVEDFAWSFLFISQGRLEAYFFSPQDRLEIFISMFILYLFQPRAP